MKNRFFHFLIFILVALTTTSCKNISEVDKSNKKLLLVSFTVLEDIVKNIVGDEFDVKSITKPGMEVHGYQTTPSDLIKGSRAEVFIDNGFGFELWAEKFVSNLKVKRITMANNLKPLFIGEDAYKGKPNPHAWISPKRGIIYVDTLSRALSELKPESKTVFKKMRKYIKINYWK